MKGQLHENIFLAFLIEIVKRNGSALFDEKFASIQLPDLPQDLISMRETMDTFPKMGSLITLIEDREHFFPSYLDQFTLYNKSTTNVIEGIVSTIKRGMENNHMSYVKRIEVVENVCLGLDNNRVVVVQIFQVPLHH